MNVEKKYILEKVMSHFRIIHMDWGDENLDGIYEHLKEIFEELNTILLPYMEDWSHGIEREFEVNGISIIYVMQKEKLTYLQAILQMNKLLEFTNAFRYYPEWEPKNYGRSFYQLANEGKYNYYNEAKANILNLLLKQEEEKTSRNIEQELIKVFDDNVVLRNYIAHWVNEEIKSDKDKYPLLKLPIVYVPEIYQKYNEPPFEYFGISSESIMKVDKVPYYKAIVIMGEIFRHKEQPQEMVNYWKKYNPDSSLSK